MAPRVSGDYVPFSTVRPMGPRDPTEHVRVEMPPVTQHNAVGQAMEQLGRQGYGTLSDATREIAKGFDNLGSNLAHAGTELWQRAIGLQDVQNQTTQTKAEIEFHKYVNDQSVAFNSLKGEAASEGVYRAHLADIEAKRKEMTEKLPNPAVQHGFSQATASTITSAGMKAASHAADQTRQAFIETSEARVDQIKDQVSKTTNPRETLELTEKIAKEIYDNQAPAKGWSPDKADDAYRKALSDAFGSQIVTISRTDPTLARKMLEDPRNKEQILQPKYDAIMGHILNNEKIILSRNIANEVQDSNPNGTLEEKKAKGKELAARHPHQIELTEDVIHQIERKHSEHRMELKQERERHIVAIDQELWGYGNKDGIVPKKIEDLYVNPETRKSLEWIRENHPKDYNRIVLILRKNAKGDIPETEATRIRRRELEGMMLNEPARFKEHDLLLEEIPLSDRAALRTMQMKIIKEGIKLEADPHTSRAINTMRSSGWLDKDIIPSNTAKWNTFTGLVREALVVLGKERGFDKPIPEADLKTMARTLQAKMPGTGYWPGDWSKKSVYQTMKEVPANTKKEMMNDFPGITEEEMLEKYQRLRFISEWNKRNKSEAGTPPAAEPKRGASGRGPVTQPPTPRNPTRPGSSW